MLPTTPGSTLIDVFEVSELAVEALDVLTGRSVGDSMPANRIPGRNDAYFAVSPTGDFLLMIAAAELQSVERRFESLTVSAGTSFHIVDQLDGTDVVSPFVAVALNAGARQLIAPFGLVSGILLRTLPERPTPTELEQLLNDFALLFAGGVPVDRQTVVGLWGELWLIFAHAEIDLATAWHADATDRYDFALETCRIEVKTSEGELRIHEFSLAQLLPQDRPTFVASLLVVPDATGYAISDLLINLLNRVPREVGARMSRVCLQTLAGDLESSSDYRFRPSGTHPLAIYAATSIPRVTVPDQAPISAVRFRVELGAVPTAADDLISLI